MKTSHVVALVSAGLLAAACQKPKPEAAAAAAAAVQPGQSDSLPVVVLETTKGRIVMQLDRKAAPRTVENIVGHVNAHFYDGLVFHRVERGFVIQAGILTAAGMEKHSSAPPVPNEAENGLKNVRGSVGLAREPDPQSGGVQFYINLQDNSATLDFRAKTAKDWGYAVFGRVIQGMDVVDKIAVVPTMLHGNYDRLPVDPVIITRAYVDTAAK